MSSLYNFQKYDSDRPYESIIWDDILGVRSRLASDCSQRLRQTCGCQAVDVGFLYSNLKVKIKWLRRLVDFIKVSTYNSEVRLCQIDLVLHKTVLVPVGYSQR